MTPYFQVDRDEWLESLKRCAIKAGSQYPLKGKLGTNLACPIHLHIKRVAKLTSID